VWEKAGKGIDEFGMSSEKKEVLKVMRRTDNPNQRYSWCWL